MNPELFQAALRARRRAHAPYSGFAVGAALRTRSGAIFGGCNIENASYGLTLCAERVAIFKALSEGEREFTELCVVADVPKAIPPCGACRQIIWEFCGDIEIYMSNLKGECELFRASRLLPLPFDDRQLEPPTGGESL